MSKTDDFEIQVQDALAHLYDLAFLERSPLTQAVAPDVRRGGGAALHRVLIETIEQLKPSREVAADALAWKIYRALHLRYVRSLSASAVAGELGLSVRQSQRIQAAAVAAMATLLPIGRSASPVETTPTREAPTSTPERASFDPLLDDELAAILSREPVDHESLATTVRSAVATVAPMIEARRTSVELTLDEALAHRIAPHDLVRPALVQLLLAALDWRSTGVVRFAATVESNEVRLTIGVQGVREVGGVEREPPELGRRVGVARRLLGALGGVVATSQAPELQIEARLPAEPAPTVLVVEDNQQVVQLFRRYFSGSPYQMIWAANGNDAFELACSSRPAAITVDLLLPRRDGWELLQLVKVHPQTRSIPVIVCSVLRERELALAMGAADFLPKPITQNALLTSLRSQVPLGRRVPVESPAEGHR